MLFQVLSSDGINLITFSFELKVVILIDTLKGLKMLHLSFGLVLLKLLNFRVFQLNDPDLLAVFIVMKSGLMGDRLAGANDLNLLVASYVLRFIERCFEIISVIFNIG